MNTTKSASSPSPREQDCLGTLFPDLLAVHHNGVARGKVFGVLIQSFGIGVQSREMLLDADAWKKCRECPRYDECYDLSMAKLGFQKAVLSF